MPYAQVAGRKLFYTRRGRGEPLLLIQGMAGHHQLWGERFLSSLEQDFDLVTFDHRGIGSSDRVDAAFTVADLAEDAAGVIAAVGWSDAHVVGISMGGMVAQELVLNHPDLVRTLTLGCSWAGGPGGSVSATAYRWVEAMATREVELSLSTGFEANLSARFTAHLDNYAIFRRLSLAVKVPAQVVEMQFRAGLAHDTSERLPTVTTPTLALHGTADALVAVTNSEHIVGLIPDARLELFDGVGHLFWWEMPERTVELLRAHTGRPLTDSNRAPIAACDNSYRTDRTVRQREDRDD